MYHTMACILNEISAPYYNEIFQSVFFFLQIHVNYIKCMYRTFTLHTHIHTYMYVCAHDNNFRFFWKLNFHTCNIIWVTVWNFTTHLSNHVPHKHTHSHVFYLLLNFFIISAKSLLWVTTSQGDTWQNTHPYKHAHVLFCFVFVLFFFLFKSHTFFHLIWPTCRYRSHFIANKYTNISLPDSIWGLLSHLSLSPALFYSFSHTHQT